MKREILSISGLCVLLLLSLFSSSALAAQYRVKSGDTLSDISKKVGVSVQQIKENNNLQSSKLKANQILNISTSKPSKQTAQPQTKRSYYTVKKGDTLYGISQKTRVPLKSLMALNPLNSKNLKPGQKIVLDKSADIKSKPLRKQDIAGHRPVEEQEEDADVHDVSAVDNETGLCYPAQNEAETSGELLGTWTYPDEAQLLVKVATGFIGAPYRFGGSSLKGIDCSSFVQKIYRIFDISLPRNAREQSKVGLSIPREELAEGDLVFFHTNRSLGHVGIYIGNNEFVHASSRNKTVRIDSLESPYYQKRFQRAVRIKGLNDSDA